MQPQPLVTIIIPAYNAAATVARALDSALAQTYRPIEVIVIDDGSKDATSEIVAAYRDERIRLLSLPRNQGESGAMNEGLASARGEYIAFLDADDEWLPTKLAEQVPMLRENPRATMVNCGHNRVDQSGDVAPDWGTPPPGLGKADLWRGLLAATYITKPCVVARASALREVGPFDTSLRIGADQDMWIRLAMAGEVEFIPDLLTVTHDTPGSLTKVYAAQTDQYVLTMVRRHIERRRHDLSNGEIRHILGARYTSIGRTLYRNGLVIRGAVLLIKAILLCHQVGENLWYLIVASPPARVVKKLVRGRTAMLSTSLHGRSRDTSGRRP
jgi:glycosyltransferase involved in cell wall biosynthesis